MQKLFQSGSVFHLETGAALFLIPIPIPNRQPGLQSPAGPENEDGTPEWLFQREKGEQGERRIAGHCGDELGAHLPVRRYKYSARVMGRPASTRCRTRQG